MSTCRPASIAPPRPPLTPAQAEAGRAAIAAANPGWHVWYGRNGMWHAQCRHPRRLEAHGGSGEELRQSIRDVKFAAGVWA